MTQAPAAPSPLRFDPSAGFPSAGPQAGPTTSLEPIESSVNPQLYVNRGVGPSVDIARFYANTPNLPGLSEQSAEGPPMTHDQVFRHSGWEPVRKKIRAALLRTGQKAHRIEAFDKCGSEAYVLQNQDAPAEFKLSANYCHDRLCTPCALARSRELAACLQAAIAGRCVSFLTLTLSHRKKPLGELIDDLYRHFRGLRQHPEWKKHVQGGAAFLEVKFSHRSNQWHPHLHIIMDATFWSQGHISTIWQTITHDSYICDIRRVSDQAVVSQYVTKYASKPLNGSYLHNDALLDEAIQAMRGRRLCLCFGSWYGTPLAERIDSDEPTPLDEVGKWQPIGSLFELHVRACAGEALARTALNAIAAYRAAIRPPPPDTC